MELQRDGMVLDARSSKRSNTLSRIAELCKIKIPKHEPQTLGSDGATAVRMNTVDTTSSLQSTGSSLSAATTNDPRESVFSSISQPATVTSATDSSHLGVSDKQNDTVAVASDMIHAIPIGSGCTALPTVAIPIKHLNLWCNEIRERLEDEIAQTFHVASHLELSMVSDAAGRVGTCILIICWDDQVSNHPGMAERLRRKLQKKVSKLQTLRTYPFPCRIVIDKISLAARGVLPNLRSIEIQGLATTNIHRTLNGSSITSCDDHRHLCRLGGIIQIGDRICGITVAHPFTDCVPSHASFTMNSREEYAESDSEDCSEDLDEDFHFGKDHTVVGNSESQGSQRSEFDSDETSRDFRMSSQRSVEDLTEETCFPIIGSIFATSTTRETPNQVDNDWALIEFENEPSVTTNSYHAADKNSEVLLKDIYKDELSPGLEVRLLTQEKGGCPAIMGQTDFKLVVGGFHLEVTQIVLSQPLAHGSSGMWVVKDDLVAGCIVAVREFAMIAYMVSMKAIVDELDRIYAPDKISIPVQGTHHRLFQNEPTLQYQDHKQSRSIKSGPLPKAQGDQPQSMLQQNLGVMPVKVEVHPETSILPTRVDSNHGSGYYHGNDDNKTKEKSPSFENDSEKKGFFVYDSEPLHADLYRLLVTDGDGPGLVRRCWTWYCRYLDDNIKKDWDQIIYPSIAGLDPALHASMEWATQLAIVYRVVEIIATGIGYLDYISLDGIIADLDHRQLLRKDNLNSNRNVHRQMTLYIAGIITTLYEPRASIRSSALKLCRPESSLRSGSIYGKRQNLLCSEQHIDDACSNHFFSVLARFGGLLPTVERDKGNILPNTQNYINVADINFHTLKCVANLEIEWVDTMNLHLQLDRRRRILRLYRFPALCRLLWANTGDSFMQTLFSDHLDNRKMARGSADHNFSDYLREMILSYRLLFGIERKSRQAFRDEVENWHRQSSVKQDEWPNSYWASTSFQLQSQAYFHTHDVKSQAIFRSRRRYQRSPSYNLPQARSEEDPLLMLLCTTEIPHKYTKTLSVDQRNLACLLSLLHGEEKSMLYDLEDFPFLGQRLAELQHYSIIQSPTNLKSLFWFDRRDKDSYMTSIIASALLIIGGATIVLQFLQLVFQFWAMVVQYSQNSGR